MAFGTTGGSGSFVIPHRSANAPVMGSNGIESTCVLDTHVGCAAVGDSVVWRYDLRGFVAY